jgi:uncharacterized membrane protein
MRQLQLHVQPHQLDPVLTIAGRHDATSTFSLESRHQHTNAPVVVFLNVPNRALGAFLDDVRRELGDTAFTFLPVGSIPIRPPLTEVQQQVRDVSSLSTMELVLSSLQSIGSWKGMLLYSAFSGIVAAYGVIFNVSYLLVAAMLINPMGAPAMVAVIGLAVGDVRMFGRGGVRFFASLLVQAGAAALLALAYGLDFSTETMEQITALSAMAALLALVAGGAGAQSQVQSERDSLVSGSAAGFMVAAALAPPAAVLGLALPIARWDYAALMGFLLFVQFVAIALGGWLTLLVFGVAPGDPSAPRGSRRGRAVLAVIVAVTLGAAVIWQVRQEPRFLKADLSRDAVRLARQSVEDVPEAGLVEARARFTRSEHERHGREGLLVELVVERLEARAPDDDDLAERVRAVVSARLRSHITGIVPFVDVTVLPPAP